MSNVKLSLKKKHVKPSHLLYTFDVSHVAIFYTNKLFYEYLYFFKLYIILYHKLLPIYAKIVLNWIKSYKSHKK